MMANVDKGNSVKADTGLSKSVYARFGNTIKGHGAPISIALAVILLVVGGAYSFFGSSNLNENLAFGHYRLAYAQALKAAKKGDLAAQNTLGNLYYLGLGVERDYGMAVRWYKKAALSGYGPAQVNLGHCYAQGFGVKKDATNTLGWYWLAQISGYEKVEDYVKIKLDELQLVPGLIQKAQTKFSSLEKVRREMSGEE